MICHRCLSLILVLFRICPERKQIPVLSFRIANIVACLESTKGWKKSGGEFCVLLRDLCWLPDVALHKFLPESVHCVFGGHLKPIAVGFFLLVGLLL